MAYHLSGTKPIPMLTHYTLDTSEKLSEILNEKKINLQDTFEYVIC